MHSLWGLKNHWPGLDPHCLSRSPLYRDEETCASRCFQAAHQSLHQSDATSVDFGERGRFELRIQVFRRSQLPFTLSIPFLSFPSFLSSTSASSGAVLSKETAFVSGRGQNREKGGRSNFCTRCTQAELKISSHSLLTGAST